MKILISACLTGENCKYNGGNNKSEELLALLSGHKLIPVCPEVMGGLPTPRTPSEIVNGKVIARDGADVDAAFRRGAALAMEILHREKPDLAILQSRSPSCGIGVIYDGTFTGGKTTGNGIFAGMVLASGIPFFDAADLNGIRWFLKTKT